MLGITNFVTLILYIRAFTLKEVNKTMPLLYLEIVWAYFLDIFVFD